MADNQAININLEGVEDVFRIVGWKAGMAVLDQRIAEHVKNSDQRIQDFLKGMEKYDKPRLQGSPASEHNMSRPDVTGLNYFAPKKNLQVMLCEEWFDKVSADKKKYDTAWREQLMDELMKSEHRDEIGRKWAQPDQRLQMKGHVIGALITAGVIKERALAVARTYYNIKENTAEVKTLAKYMGDSRRMYYAEWIVSHVQQQVSSPKED